MKMARTTGYKNLKELFERNPIPPFESHVAELSRAHRVDYIAQSQLPDDAPCARIPVCIYGDGNCCPRAISVAVGQDKNDFHREMHARICYKGVMN